MTGPSTSRPRSTPNLYQLLDSVSPNYSSMGVRPLKDSEPSPAPLSESAPQLTIRAPLYSPPRSQFMPFESTIDLSRLVLPTPPRPIYGAIPAPALGDLPSPGRPERPVTRQRRERPRKPKRAQPFYQTPSPRRKPVTPKYSFRSRRDSPPHFDNRISSDPPDDPTARGSPQPSTTPFPYGYDQYEEQGEIAPFNEDQYEEHSEIAPYQYEEQARHGEIAPFNDDQYEEHGLEIARFNDSDEGAFDVVLVFPLLFPYAYRRHKKTMKHSKMSTA